jgi:hypothetical protein
VFEISAHDVGNRPTSVDLRMELLSSLASPGFVFANDCEREFISCNVDSSYDNHSLFCAVINLALDGLSSLFSSAIKSIAPAASLSYQYYLFSPPGIFEFSHAFVSKQF